jgi:hypothetical protein
MGEDGDKTAAAILAVEAYRQLNALNPQSAQRPGQNVSANLVTLYRGILSQLVSQRP